MRPFPLFLIAIAAAYGASAENWWAIIGDIAEPVKTRLDVAGVAATGMGVYISGRDEGPHDFARLDKAAVILIVQNIPAYSELPRELAARSLAPTCGAESVLHNVVAAGQHGPLISSILESSLSSFVVAVSSNYTHATALSGQHGCAFSLGHSSGCSDDLFDEVKAIEISVEADLEGDMQVELEKLKIESCVLASTVDNRELMAELAFAAVLPQRLMRSKRFRALVKDESPDLYQIIVSSNVSDDCARSIVSAAAVRLIDGYASLYGDLSRVSRQIIGVSSLLEEDLNDKHNPFVALQASSTDYSPPSSLDVEIYQIVMWLSIALAIVVYFSFYAMAFISFQRDSLLYSKFNPNWAKKMR